MTPAAATAEGPSTEALLATGCGTAVASVCTLGLFQIERLLGGVWSAAAVAVAAALCLWLAAALSHLTHTLPSGAALLAPLSRALGPPPALLLTVPYLLMTLFLLGAESIVVGLLLKTPTGLPAPLGAAAFLLLTYALCRAGVRLSLRAQSLATWSLLLSLMALSIAATTQVARTGALRLLAPAPTPLRFLTAVGQALFLFMGFELLTAQAGAAPPRRIGHALRGCVLILGLFYATVALGFSCLDPRALVGAEAALLPQLAMAQQAGGPAAVLLIIGLSLLASFTSINGALLSLSRLSAALASQGVLPRAMARIDGRSLMPRAALQALLGAALLSTAAIFWLHLLPPAIFAAAVTAAGVYAGLALSRARPPFSPRPAPLGLRLFACGLAALLLVLAIGVVADAGPHQRATLALLLLCYGAAAALVWARARRGRRLPPAPPRSA